MATENLAPQRCGARVLARPDHRRACSRSGGSAGAACDPPGSDLLGSRETLKTMKRSLGEGVLSERVGVAKQVCFTPLTCSIGSDTAAWPMAICAQLWTPAPRCSESNV